MSRAAMAFFFPPPKKKLMKFGFVFGLGIFGAFVGFRAFGVLFLGLLGGLGLFFEGFRV